MKMKKSPLLFLLFLMAILPVSAQETGYKLDFQIEGFKDSIAHLTFFYGKNYYYKDTAEADSKGNFTFDGKEPLDPGMFSVFSGQEKLLDFFVMDDQHFKITSVKDEIIQELKVEGSKENEIFFEYLKFLKKKQNEAAALSAQKDTNNPDSEENKKLKEKVEALDKEVKDHIDNFKNEHPNSFTVKFLKSMDWPEPPPVAEGGEVDSVGQLQYMRQHLFDNIDFSDARSVRIPSYHERMDYFLEKLTYPIPDSVIVSLDYLLGEASKNDEIFKYTLNYVTQKYERSNMMGMDEVFVYLVNNYFKKGKAPWITDKQMKKIVERGDALEPLLIGKKAPNIVVKDTAQKEFIQLYDVDAKYIVVYIWSPECGHCKVSTPILYDIYKKYKDQGLKVFAVGNEFENEAWLQFIRKHNLDWINGSDGGDFRSNFRHLYDVYSTPQTYLLDKDMKIISKKMDMESLEKILEFQIEQDKKADYKKAENKN